MALMAYGEKKKGRSARSRYPSRWVLRVSSMSRQTSINGRVLMMLGHGQRQITTMASHVAQCLAWGASWGNKGRQARPLTPKSQGPESKYAELEFSRPPTHGG